jgi:hypothetical protein
MYRKPGSLGVLHGVLSGPYTGGIKRVDAAKLPRASRQRLADALAGRSEPSAIVYERASDLGARFPAFWGLVVALSSFATLFAIGFGDLRSPRALQPSSWLAGYLVATGLFACSLLVLVRRRALSSGQELRPGRYLLPLDLVDVPACDRHGRQILSVTPLGDARDAILRAQGKKRELVIVFEDGREERFAIRSDAAGEFALTRLEHSQRLLEELTYVGEIDKAFAHDPLFDLRVDASWETVTSIGPGTPSSVTRGLLHGPAAWAMAGAIAIGLAFGGLAARNRLSDRALWLRALSQNTPEAFAAYLEKGRSYRVEAEMLRTQILTAREEAAARAKPGTPEPHAVARSTYDCLASLGEHASPAHPETARIVESLLQHARTTQDPLVPVVFHRRVEEPPNDAPPLDLDEREERLVTAFERVFSETCPASLIRFVRWTKRTDARGLEVSYVVSWPRGATWERTEMGKRSVVHGITMAFDVTLRGSLGWSEAAQFRLTMPAPREPITELRDRSLYALPLQAKAFDERAYPAMTARAFDRLYDEIFELFFAGDPRVPIAEEAVLEDWSK